MVLDSEVQASRNANIVNTDPVGISYSKGKKKQLSIDIII